MTQFDVPGQIVAPELPLSIVRVSEPWGAARRRACVRALGERVCLRRSRRMMRYLVLLALAGAACAEKARFDNYRVHSVLPETDAQLRFLHQMEEKHRDFTFWSNARQVNTSVHIMVPPHKSEHFHKLAELGDLKHEIYIHDVQKLIDEENDHPSARSGIFGWKAYYRLDVIYDWMSSLEEKYPGIVKVEVGGSSFEERQIKGVKVIYDEDNPGVFIEAGIHAREWITPATVTYILNEILTRTDSEFRTLVESYNWYIFPCFNPDGYEYTHTTYRLWRKTRSRGTTTECFGADPNRNWDFHWNDGGTSNNECSDIYRGSKAFSEKETESLSKYIDTIKDKIQIYLSFHSHGQKLLIPYGFQNADRPEHILDNYEELRQIGVAAMQQLYQKYQTRYDVGRIVNVMGASSGSSLDWVRGAYNTRFTYAYELRDEGRYGFLLPAPQIIPTGEETLVSVIYIIQKALDLINIDKSTPNPSSPAE